MQQATPLSVFFVDSVYGREGTEVLVGIIILQTLVLRVTLRSPLQWTLGIVSKSNYHSLH